ncbi:MAG: 30S ribosomal protein S18 [Chloroflexia bacterium]|jgi:small subunit ribosomal protein S18|nr:30S ribosomal protein S18 [Chloroflexia bacterium]
MSDNSQDRDNRGPRPEGGEGRPGGSRFGGPQGQRPGGGEGEGGGRRPGGSGGRRPSGGRYTPRRKVSAFAVDNIQHVDYKDLARLRRHVGERGKIEPRRKMGTSAKHQRSLTVAIKRARYMALLPFTGPNERG